MSKHQELSIQIKEINPGIGFELAYSCPLRWEEMAKTQDERCRHCTECDLNVFDLVGLTNEEIQELIAAHDGEICGRAYFRSDNTLAMNPCKFPRKALRGKIRPVNK